MSRDADGEDEANMAHVDREAQDGNTRRSHDLRTAEPQRDQRRAPVLEKDKHTSTTSGMLRTTDDDVAIDVFTKRVRRRRRLVQARGNPVLDRREIPDRSAVSTACAA